MMGRPPLGTRPMTATERMRKTRTRRRVRKGNASKLAEAVAVLQGLAPPSTPFAVDPREQMLNLRHIELSPETVAHWIYQKLGNKVTWTFMDALREAVRSNQPVEHNPLREK